MFAGYLASLGYVLLLAVGTFCFGYAAKRSSALYVLWLETLLGASLILPLLLLLEPLSLPQLLTKPQVQNWGWLSASALFGFVGGNYFSLINLKTAGEQTNSLPSPAITAVTVLLSLAVFAENCRQCSGWALSLCWQRLSIF
ncbi:MAG: EamA family transporter [Chitinophagaceae bacterium]